MKKTIKLILAVVIYFCFKYYAFAGSYSGPDLSGQKVTISGPY